METEKLYYNDAFLTECEATVVSCEQGKGRYEVVLDRTVFYPEGGGQPGDTGYLNDVRVLDTHEKNGQVVHYCERAIEPGTKVTAKIDWDRRFDLMQQHSGEHIFSGLVHEKYGYNNVGFHLGADTVTVDFDGEIDEAGLREVELRANEILWRDDPVDIFYPTPDELAALSYRSKKELTGRARTSAPAAGRTSARPGRSGRSRPCPCRNSTAACASSSSAESARLHFPA